MDKPIIDFIKEHHVMTLATMTCGMGSGEKQQTQCTVPYCSNLFYAWDGTHFVVTSSDSTRHAQDAARNPNVAAAIVLETKTVGKIQGLQLQGIMRRPCKEEMKNARKAYLRAFPFAVFMDLELWFIEPTFAKLTDNRLGFGKKLVWTAQ